QLSALGAAALVALVVFGPVAVLALAFAAGLSAAIGPVVRDPWRRAAAISADPWQAWRSVEPDPEYLRRRAA
ncbi:MAG TPA: hypothetical protein VFQ40_04585, partial [Actinomycetota bacterium]|nr:hypothetical protein [Actinomycetota bacterium]